MLSRRDLAASSLPVLAVAALMTAPAVAPGQDPPVGNAQVTIGLVSDSKPALIRERRLRVTAGSDVPVGMRAKVVLRAPGRVIMSQQIGYTLPGGGAERTKSVPISARARRALKTVRKGLKVVVEGTAIDAAGAETPVEETIRISQR